MRAMIKSMGAIALTIASACVCAQTAQYSLATAITRAQANDPWLSGSLQKQNSLQAQSIAAGTLPDPTINISLANLPVDSFDFSQEAMTQFKVGVSQMFPRGDSLSLQREKLKALSDVQPYARAERSASVAVQVAQLWLEIYRNQKTIALIEGDRQLFENLVDVAQSNYATAMRSVRQQDLIRAQLELTRLDDRMTQLQQMRQTHLAQMGEWLQSEQSIDIRMPKTVSVPLGLPQLIEEQDTQAKLQLLTRTLSAHPLIRGIDQRIQASGSEIKLAQQSYKPQWGLNASYGYRDEDLQGRDRADFFSVGVSFDLPLFTGNRQDQQVQAATAGREQIKTEKALALRQLRARYEAAEAGYRLLQDRKQLFDSRLLKEISEQADASLNAYRNDDGDFAEVVRARIAELNARIDALNVDIDIQKTIIQMNYYLVGAVASAGVGENNE